MKLGHAMVLWVLLAFFGSDALAQPCVYCATRSSCWPTTGPGSESCYYDGNSCSGMGACGGAKCKTPTSCFEDGEFRAPWNPVRALDQSTDRYVANELPPTMTDGYVLRASTTELQAIASDSPRLGESLLYWTLMSGRGPGFGKSGELVISAKSNGIQAIFEAIAQGRPVPTVADGPDLRFSKAVYWSGDSSLLMVIRTQSPTASGDFVEPDRELYARFSRNGFDKASDGRSVPAFDLVSWEVETTQVREGRELLRPVR